METQKVFNSKGKQVKRDRRSFSTRFKVDIVEKILTEQLDARSVKDRYGRPIDSGNVQIWIDRYKLGKLKTNMKRRVLLDQPKVETKTSEVTQPSFHEILLLKSKLLEIENNYLRSAAPQSGIDSLLNKVLRS